MSENMPERETLEKHENMFEEATSGKSTKKRFSRRSLVKIGASVFAFIPAAKYLASAPEAFAYVPCDPTNRMLIVWIYSYCWDPNCTGTNTRWDYYAMYDYSTRVFCGSFGIDSGVPC